MSALVPYVLFVLHLHKFWISCGNNNNIIYISQLEIKVVRPHYRWVWVRDWAILSFIIFWLLKRIRMTLLWNSGYFLGTSVYILWGHQHISDLINKIQIQERLKRMSFIRTKHNMRIFGVIPFIKLQYDASKPLNGEERRKMRWRAKPVHLFMLGWAMLFSCPKLGRMLACWER